MAIYREISIEQTLGRPKPVLFEKTNGLGEADFALEDICFVFFSLCSSTSLIFLSIAYPYHDCVIPAAASSHPLKDSVGRKTIPPL